MDRAKRYISTLCRVDWLNLLVWISIVLLTVLFWWGVYSVALADAGVSSPPEEYDYPHPNAVITEYESLSDVGEVCARRMGSAAAEAILSQGLVIYGCAPVWTNARTGETMPVPVCTIDVWEAAGADVVRHEMAHCNGWSHKP